MKYKNHHQHHWTGWPGAICFHCGCEDPMEIALADNDYDPISNTWTTEERRKQFLEDNNCPIMWDLDCPQCKANH